MRKTELRELYKMMFPDYPDIVTVAQLQKMLGEGYEVRNFGHSGACLLSKGHRPYINLPEYKAALDFAPDIVIIHLGLNDTDPRNWPCHRDEFHADYYALIDSFKTTARLFSREICCINDAYFSPL